MHSVRYGSGRPLVLVPGVGASADTWRFIVADLAAQREIVAVDLPGMGRTPMFTGEVTLARYADALESFLRDAGLADADLVGSSLGARLVLEMARRGLGRSTVALDPGGFWNPVQKKIFGSSLGASVALVRALRPALPTLLANPVGRTLLLAQLSARPWALPEDFALSELRSLADSLGSSPSIRALARGPDQAGAPAGTLPGPILMVWGRQYRVTTPSQAGRAANLFPDAHIELFDSCGHFPHWDQPERTARTILTATA